MNENGLQAILHHAYGYWASAILATGLKHEVFGHLAKGADSVESLAKQAGISIRGSQALLDGLSGLGLVRCNSQRYANDPIAATYLLSDSREYIGGYADMIFATLADWSKLPEAVASGDPLTQQERADPNNSFWENLVKALAPVSAIPAKTAARTLGLADKASFRMLDIGGGAGAYSALWLDINPRGHCTQVDWPNVNVVARDYVEALGHAEKFHTIDGDMESLELPNSTYDYVIYANVAHGLSAERNIAMFRRIKAWLKPNGVLTIVSLMPDDTRNGDPMLMMFGCNLLLNSQQGKLHVGQEYEHWLKSGGFTKVRFERAVGLPFTLIYGS